MPMHATISPASATSIAVEHAAALFELAAVNANISQIAVLIVDDLEDQAAEGFVRIGMPLDGFFRVLHIVTDDGGHVHRRREIVDHAVDQSLHAHIFQRRSGEHGVQLEADGGGAEGVAQFLLGGFLGVEIFLHQVVICFGDFFDEIVPPFFVSLFFLGRNGLFEDALAAILVVADGVIQGDPPDQVDHPLEGVALADGNLHGHGRCAQALADGVEAEIEVRADLVHLVDEADARNVVLGGLPPDGFGLGFDPFLAVEHGDRAVEHAQGSLDLGGKIDVTGRVDQVDGIALAVAVPRAGGGGGIDGDAAFLLFLVEVHDGGSLVDLAHLVDFAGVVEDALRDGGFARVDVGGNSDVPNFGQVPSHKNPQTAFQKRYRQYDPKAVKVSTQPRSETRRKSDVM